jgi:hypothetical protein
MKGVLPWLVRWAWRAGTKRLFRLFSCLGCSEAEFMKYIFVERGFHIQCFITNQFQTTFVGGVGGGVKSICEVTVNSKEEKLLSQLRPRIWLLSAQFKILFSSPYTISIYVFPSASNLGRQSCRAAFLWMCVSGGPTRIPPAASLLTIYVKHGRVISLFFILLSPLRLSQCGT